MAYIVRAALPSDVNLRTAIFADNAKHMYGHVYINASGGKPNGCRGVIDYQ